MGMNMVILHCYKSGMDGHKAVNILDKDTVPTVYDLWHNEGWNRFILITGKYGKETLEIKIAGQ